MASAGTSASLFNRKKIYDEEYCLISLKPPAKHVITLLYTERRLKPYTVRKVHLFRFVLLFIIIYSFYQLFAPFFFFYSFSPSLTSFVPRKSRAVGSAEGVSYQMTVKSRQRAPGQSPLIEHPLSTFPLPSVAPGSINTPDGFVSDPKNLLSNSTTPFPLILPAFQCVKHCCLDQIQHAE